MFIISKETDHLYQLTQDKNPVALFTKDELFELASCVNNAISRVNDDHLPKHVLTGKPWRK